MALYFIAHDLHPTRVKTYAELRNAIFHLGTTAWHGLDAAWLVVSHKPAMEISRELRRFMRAKDSLLVIACDPTNASWSGFDPMGTEWLRDHLGPNTRALSAERDATGAETRLSA